MKKKILIAPLNWGIGHATRCIPIIRLLLKNEAEVVIASDGAALEVLKEEFPALLFFELPSYNPIYPKGNNMIAKMASQLFKFTTAIKLEHKALSKIVSENEIDIVISDNRYGCYSSAVESILITHQSTLLMPKGASVLGKIVNYFNFKQIQKFNRLWIPDYSGQRNLTGNLSDGNGRRKKFIGQLSRFQKIPNSKKKYDLIAVISGPEPQRTQLETIVKKQFENYTQGTTLLVKGNKSGSQDIQQHGNASEVDFLNSHALNKALEESKIVIARSGYSTIMDLAKLGKKAIFIPTPGQTEQLYLAESLKSKGIAYQTSQNNFNLERALQKTTMYKGFGEINYENEILEGILLKLLE